MWTYLLGPFLSLFPKPWRQALPFSRSVQWGPAAAVGGFLETVAALFALSHWYFSAMIGWVSNGMEAAESGKMGAGITELDITSAAYTVWITHPLTWLISYFAFEGTVRLCSAAFTGGVFGTLPLVLLDKLLFAPFRYRPLEARTVAASPVNDRPSFLDMICDWRFLSRGSEVADEIFYDRIAGEDFLEIHAGRRKKDWGALPGELLPAGKLFARNQPAPLPLQVTPPTRRSARPHRARIRAPRRCLLTVSPRNPSNMSCL
jgi:hypothetical protein